MLSDSCGWSLLLALPDDIFATVACSLNLRDLFNISICCRSLFHLVNSDKVWLAQCDKLGIVSPQELVAWRKGVSSYKALCRFLIGIQSLIGIWVHQNPELGNVVYVMPGFVSVVGCRIIPQELPPFGLEEGPLLWAPVFEIVSDFDGLAAFFLHGRDKENDCVYPGLLKGVDRGSNVLLLEVEPRQQRNGGKLVHSKSYTHSSNKELSRKVFRSNRGVSKSLRVVGQNAPMVPFSRLSFGDRRKLLELVTSQVGVIAPDSANGLLFSCMRGDEDKLLHEMLLLYDRRSMLMQMHRPCLGHTDSTVGAELPPDPTQLELSEIRKSFDGINGIHGSLEGDDFRTHCTKRKSLSGYFRNGLKQILGKSTSASCSSSSEDKHAQLHEFLQSGDTIGLILHASTMKLSSYRAWPNMHESRYALYKLPMWNSTVGQEYAGLWGGTFGWPPGRPIKEKPGKALFFLLLSYKESEGQRILIATKILEGTHYVLHPNGSAMFMVNIDQPSLDPFPYKDADSLPIDTKHAFKGEGIANGYGFRYPGSKPGSLFVIQDGLLAFIWEESGSVLTLQKLNLQELLKKGERVPPLPPIANFAYLTRSYSNIYASFSNASNCVSSLR